jgi:hypothetical protein
MRKNTGENSASVDEDYKNAAALAAMVAPFRHARLSAMKIADDPNTQARFKDNASIEELRAEVMEHLKVLAPVLDLEAFLLPAEPDQPLDATGQVSLSKRPAARRGYNNC